MAYSLAGFVQVCAINAISDYIRGSPLGDQYGPKTSYQTRSMDFGQALPLLSNGLPYDGRFSAKKR